MTTMQEAFKKFCKTYITPDGNTCVVMAVAGEQIVVLSAGHPDLLADLAAGVLDKHKNGCFTQSQDAVRILNALGQQAFGPQAQMSVSICVDGEWKRLTTGAELRAALL